jgi:hypothetical protein
MEWIGTVLVGVALLLALLDLVLWNATANYRTHRLLQWAVLILAIGVLIGAHGVLVH